MASNTVNPLGSIGKEMEIQVVVSKQEKYVETPDRMVLINSRNIKKYFMWTLTSADNYQFCSSHFPRMMGGTQARRDRRTGEQSARLGDHRVIRDSSQP